MSPLALIAAIAVAAAIYIVMQRLCSRTDREVAIPLGSDGYDQKKVVAVLEKMGCTVTLVREREIKAVTSMDAFHWRQIVSVRQVQERLLVRSCFSRSQVFGGPKNQANVDRFRRDWTAYGK